MLRTANCGQLTAKDAGKEATLCGWVQSRRDHGGVIFIDLRDRWGLTQVVFDPSHNKDAHKTAEHLGREWVLRAVGHVRPRKPGMANPKMPTGEVEVIADHLDVLNPAEVPPFEIDDRSDPAEEMRLTYRYLDLRRPKMARNLVFRSQLANALRSHLVGKGFVEVETPTFAKYTPGGARNYLVPSRVHPGKFYALAESPQVYKQILMVSGIDRYFQIARCFRDEDLRIDRQPEFTQLDIEMSFIDREDIFELCEGIVSHAFKALLGVTVKTPFPRFSWHDAMSRFGSEKPDLRFGLELADVTELAGQSDFAIFKSVISKGGVVFCLKAEGCAGFTRNEIEEIEKLGKTHHLPGVAWVKVGKEGAWEGTPAKFFKPALQKLVNEKAKAEHGDLLLFAAERFERATEGLGFLRLHLGQKLGLVKPGEYAFAWVTDMPLFEPREGGGWQAAHHVFTMPLDEDMKYLETEPGKVRAKRYDLAMNGVEIAGGSIRIHRKEVQEQVLKVAGISMEEVRRKFGFLLDAFKFGAPPHGGIAFGFDRFCTLLGGALDIREFIAFPKNKAAQGMMEGSPNDVSDAQLKELHVKLDIAKPVPAPEKK